MREDDRAEHVVVAVDGIHPVEDRDLETRLHRDLLVGVIHVRPGLQAVACLRIRRAPGEERAQEVGLDVLHVGELLLLRLRHLADLLLERHLREERLGLRVVGGELLARHRRRGRDRRGEDPGDGERAERTKGG